MSVRTVSFPSIKGETIISRTLSYYEVDTVEQEMSIVTF